MGLTDWNSVLATVAEALADWGANVVVRGKGLRELRDFGMDFTLDTVDELPSSWPDTVYEATVSDQYPRLVRLLEGDPMSRQAVITFPPADGTWPSLLQVAFALRHGALDMTIVARSNRFPDLFAADVGPCLHLQERLAGALGVPRGRCSYFCLFLHQPL